MEKRGNIVYLKVTSDGTTGADWLKRLSAQGVILGPGADEVLLSEDFKVTSGRTTQLAIFLGEGFSDDERHSSIIAKEAGAMGFRHAELEIGCLLASTVSYAQLRTLGLWYLRVLRPVGAARRILTYGDLRITGAGARALGAPPTDSDPWWDPTDGFVFQD